MTDTPRPDNDSAESELLPDTPVEPVTLERIAEIFDMQGLEYRLEEQTVGETEGEAQTVRMLRSGFSNAAIAMQLSGDSLTVDSVWRGSIPTSEGPTLLMVINQWNQDHFAPTFRFFEGPEQTLAVSGVRQLNVAHGASRNQIGAFVMSTLDAILQSFAWVEQQYPQLVTWEEHNHD
ncbi:YbjN domain-containing protein [Corynebacterium sp.]|uniref:YbjN domain-containing protein n=1 Tax=Corynebacterium sp. TaxID=1720 RepID=UPI0026DB7DC6|nr:YbjN domain-containing protein [Corynebacterium sp.]MDO5031508.1 YbjN domain-containing protein [Corynebacterium sp.]